MEGPAFTHGILTGFLFAFLLLCLELNGCHGARLINSPVVPASVQFIKTSCGATAYPQLCFSSLSGYASEIQTNPVQLANTALSLALTSARSASTLLTRASAAGGMKPRDVAAVRDCMELMGDSVDELRQSLAVMGNLGGQKLGMQISDMQTWVSAALTDDDTCVEGLQGGAAGAGNSGVGEVKKMVRGHVLNVAQMTSNALALINGLVSIRSSSP
ncbi:hypothetical protein Taro_020421 [Colocasia esculenta]|uniref:Pectinesterase inhibitor domain-containing protein n=1 Tax=Colocasia esculenta TaxID=4460 RepID=A0A843UW71_COLES|nr:hypothetical protein [Colocasia esculenta]